MDSDTLASIGAIIACIAPIVFLVGLIMAIVSKTNRKTAVKMMIISVIAFAIGFGTCLTNLSLGSMH